jgi:hypothetical protein
LWSAKVLAPLAIRKRKLAELHLVK